MSKTTNTSKLREKIWPLMPIDRCYGEPDIWCEDCKKALDAIMKLITAALETQDEQSRIDELEKLDIDQAHNWSPLLTSAGQRHINARIAELSTPEKEQKT